MEWRSEFYLVERKLWDNLTERSRIMKKVNKLDKSILQLSEGKGPTNKLKMENGASVNISEPKR